MNILFFPWRDVNIIKKEGLRTREANILKGLNEGQHNILLINRINNFELVKNIMSSKSISTQKNILTVKKSRKNVYQYNELVNTKSIEWKNAINPKGNRIESLSIINQYLTRKILKLIKTQNWSKDKEIILWSTDVSRIFLVKRLKEILCESGYKVITVFDMIDNLEEHSSYSQNMKTKFSVMYKEWDNISDLVFSGSQKNIEKFKKTSFKRHYANGVDQARFLMPNYNDNPTTERKIKFVYTGIVEKRIDTELLQELVDNLKKNKINFEINIYGPIIDKEVFENLKKIEQVFLHGPVEYEKIPDILNKNDIALVPHVVNEFTLSMSPLKIYEYLAARKNIVMTNIPPYKDLSHLQNVKVSFNNKEFIEHSLYFCENIENLKTMVDESKINKLLEEYDWTKIANNMIRDIKNLIKSNHKEVLSN